MSDFGWSYPAGCGGPPDDDYAEECPVCAAPNHDEETGEPLCAAAPDFCSVECSEAYAKAQVAGDAWVFDRWRDERMEGPQLPGYGYGMGRPPERMTDDEQAAVMRRLREAGE